MASTTRVALVTGANRGLGLEVSRQLLSQGFVVYLGVRRPDAAGELSRQLGAHARIRALDVTREPTVTALVEEIQGEIGFLSSLVNNAAVHYDDYQTAAEADLRIVEEALATNVVGAWRMAVSTRALLKNAGHATLVNVSSGAGALRSIGSSTPAYSVSKAALNALTLSLAADLRDSAVLVNAVCPGWVRTDMGGSNAPRSVQDGARGIVWAATLPAGGPNGGFFRDGRPISWLDD